MNNVSKTMLGANINRNYIANYFADCWGEDIDEYQDWSSQELINLIRDMNKYDEFIEYIS